MGDEPSVWYAGMAAEVCKEVPGAKELFGKASEILGYDLLTLCTEGPAEKLNSTEFAQPALFVAGMAAVEKLKASEESGVRGVGQFALQFLLKHCNEKEIALVI